MWSTVLGDLFPIAAAVALSPIPIIAVVVVLGSPHARTSGPAFAAGWVIGLAAVSMVVVLLVGGASSPDSGPARTVSWIEVAIGVAFLALAVQQWSKRPRDGVAADMPAWMATVDGATPRRAFVLGLALSGANPKNLALTLTASTAIARADLGRADTSIAVAVYVILGSITVAGAVLFALVDPTRAARPLGAIRRFMTRHNAVIMTIILLLLGAKLLVDGLGGV